MGMSTGGHEGDAVAEINVTPMVDVLLSLLIIFMVSTPAPPNEKLPLDLPKDTVIQQPNDPNAALLITIGADGRARLGKNQLPPDFDGMVARLRDNQKVQADGRVSITADPKVPYGRVIQVMSAAHEAGVPEVGIASDRL